MFDDLIESTVSRASRSRTSVLLSLTAHFGLVGVLFLVPVVFYSGLPQQEVLAFLPPPMWPEVQPPKPATPPRTPATPEPPATGIFINSFMPPDIVPDKIPEPRDERTPSVSELINSVRTGAFPPGSVPSSDPSGSPLETVDVSEPPPPPPVNRKPIRVGNGVQRSKLIHRVKPVYPPLAKRARVEGPVLLRAVVDQTGRVTDLTVVRGHTLLRQSAVDAVSQWIYRPTLLNDEPVPVVTTVTVIFRLR